MGNAEAAVLFVRLNEVEEIIVEFERGEIWCMKVFSEEVDDV